MRGRERSLVVLSREVEDLVLMSPLILYKPKRVIAMKAPTISFWKKEMESKRGGRR